MRKRIGWVDRRTESNESVKKEKGGKNAGGPGLAIARADATLSSPRPKTASVEAPKMTRLVFLIGLIACASSPLMADDRPNVVIIYADDLGYADVGPFATNIQHTPNLDRMARELDEKYESNLPDVLRRLRAFDLEPFEHLQFSQCRTCSPCDELAALLKLVDDKVINPNTAKRVLETMYATGEDAAAIVEREGLAMVSVITQTGYIDHQGKVVIEPQFDYGHAFKAGRALVAKAGQEQYIDNTGRVITKDLHFSQGQDFAQGLAAVNVDGQFGYINLDGELAIKPPFAYAESFAEGLAAGHIRQRASQQTHQGDAGFRPRKLLFAAVGDGGHGRQGAGAAARDQVGRRHEQTIDQPFGMDSARGADPAAHRHVAAVAHPARPG